jgi:uncharacterized protein
MIDQDTRDRILSAPETLLEDSAVMNALIAANERAMGANVIDLRGIAMERLESRLDRLEDTHRTVIAAAYENLAGTNQVHRAVLQILDATTFEAFLTSLNAHIGPTLRVECVKLVLESVQPETAAALRRISDVVHVAEAGFVSDYLTSGRNGPGKTVVLRQVLPAEDSLYGDKAGFIRSEALMRLDLGTGRLPGLLVLGAEDPHQFKPNHGTDLLAFLAGVFERAMRRWLS